MQGSISATENKKVFFFWSSILKLYPQAKGKKNSKSVLNSFSGAICLSDSTHLTMNHTHWAISITAWIILHFNYVILLTAPLLFDELLGSQALVAFNN